MTIADRVRSLEWHHEGATLPEVLDQLMRHRAELGRQDAGEDDHPHPRNCCLNLVTVTPDREHVERVERAGRDIASQHPLRMLTLLLEPDHTEERMDASITSDAHDLGNGVPIQAELIRLHVVGPAASQPRTLLDPLLVPDVPTFLWWLGTPPVGAGPFLDALEVADALVLDSSTYERPFVTTLEVAGLVDVVGGRMAVGDLQWGRLDGWRELLAQVFTPVDRRVFLGGVNGLGIDYVGEGRGNRVAAALLVAWLADALGWTLRQAAAGQGGLVVAYYEAAGHPLEVNFRSVSSSDLAEGEVSAVRLDMAASGQTSAVALERDPDHRSRVRVRIELGEAKSFEEVRPMATAGETELLVEQIVQRRDPVYLAALAGAAELLRAFR